MYNRVASVKRSIFKVGLCSDFVSISNPTKSRAGLLVIIPLTITNHIILAKIFLKVVATS